MAPLIVLVVALVIFRGLGSFGVAFFASWQADVSYGLAVMLLLTASAHFTRMREDLIRMVPAAFPAPRLIVTITGILELLASIGLVIPATRTIAGVCLVLLLLAMFPANINAARRNVLLRGKPPTPLLLRTLLQTLFIAATLWAAFGHA